MYTLAIDVMGGDNAPDSVIEGLSRVYSSCLDFSFHLFGDEPTITKLLKTNNLPSDTSQIVIHHADNVLSDAEKPATALRNSAGTSMRRAIEAVKDGTCSAVVSAGNTGAYMALCKVILKTMPDIDRPALVGLMPARNRACVMLDVGANIGSTPLQLLQFSVFGRAYATCMLNIESPTVGLLNIGTEDMKGTDDVRETKALMEHKMPKDRFVGFVEANDIFENRADVVITDGFNGNISIKTAEGVLKLMRRDLKSALQTSPLARLAAWFLGRNLRAFEKTLDPRNYNGAPLLGLTKLAMKSHGGADAHAFANCLQISMQLVKKELITRIADSLKKDT